MEVLFSREGRVGEGEGDGGGDVGGEEAGVGPESMLCGAGGGERERALDD